MRLVPRIASPPLTIAEVFFACVVKRPDNTDGAEDILLDNLHVRLGIGENSGLTLTVRSHASTNAREVGEDTKKPVKLSKGERLPLPLETDPFPRV